MAAVNLGAWWNPYVAGPLPPWSVVP